MRVNQFGAFKHWNRTDEEIVEIIKNQLNLGDTNAVIANLELPTEGARATQISWHSSNPDVVSAQGVVNRPAAGSENATVSLTATIKKGDATAEKTFSIVVLAEKDAKLVARYSFEGDLTDGTGNVGVGTVTGKTESITQAERFHILAEYLARLPFLMVNQEYGCQMA